LDELERQTDRRAALCWNGKVFHHSAHTGGKILRKNFITKAIQLKKFQTWTRCWLQ